MIGTGLGIANEGDNVPRKKEIRNPALGERLRTLRKERGYTLAKDFAKALDIPQSMLSYLENGQLPQSHTLVKMAQLLTTTTDYLTGRVDTPDLPVYLTPEEHEMLTRYRDKDLTEENAHLEGVRRAIRKSPRRKPATKHS